MKENKKTIGTTIEEIKEFLSFIQQPNLKDKANQLLEDLYLFKERIDLCMLMMACIQDVSIPTCGEIYEWETTMEFPMIKPRKGIDDTSRKELIDTEVIYNTIEEHAKELYQKIYDEPMLQKILLLGWNEYDAEATPNFFSQVHAMMHLSVTDLIDFYNEFNRLYDLVDKNKITTKLETIINPILKTIRKCETDKKCPHCDKKLYYSDLPQYDYVCVNCNENFYESEVK